MRTVVMALALTLAACVLPGLDDACTSDCAAFATRCDGEKLQTCGVDDGLCFKWQPSESCEAGTVCKAASDTVASCVAPCTGTCDVWGRLWNVSIISVDVPAKHIDDSPWDISPDSPADLVVELSVDGEARSSSSPLTDVQGSTTLAGVGLVSQQIVATTRICVAFLDDDGEGSRETIGSVCLEGDALLGALRSGTYEGGGVEISFALAP